MPERRVYWPLDVLPPERQSALHRSEIRFLETAYREGFSPYVEGLEHVAAAPNGREGSICRRGHKWWGEIFLSESGTGGGRAFVDNFDAAADAVLQWLRGEKLADILSRIPDHQTPVPWRGKEPAAGHAEK